ALSTVHASAIERADLAARAGEDINLARALWQITIRAVHRSEHHALILARQGATERVVAFLLDFAGRLGQLEVIDLPMTRQDIADYTGLTIPPACRPRSRLPTEGLSEARATRHVRLIQRGRLESLCA